MHALTLGRGTLHQRANTHGPCVPVQLRPRARVVARTAAPEVQHLFQQQQQQQDRPVVLLNHLKETAKSRYKTLLSMDGGGMRGMVTAVVLQRLENTVKRVILTDDLIDQQRFAAAFPGQHMPTTISSFDIRLGDYFHMLAGTSTGGLLALYLGAQVQCGDHPNGTAAGAIHLYEEDGKTIFPEHGKLWDFLLSGLEGCHRSGGLEQVLSRPLDDMTLADLKTDTVVCSVDAANMRSAVFMGINRDLDSNTPMPATTEMWTGFGTYERQSVGLQSRKIPCRSQDPDGPMTDVLCAGDIKLVDQELAHDKERANEAWLPPFTYYKANFKLAHVARATSAAPGFLPPCREIEPVESSPAESRQLWQSPETKPVFVDGGMANNDPALLGLMVLLTGHGDTSITDTAILSIGCGVATNSSSWSAPSGIGGKIQAILRAFDKGLAIVGLAMNAQLEDKASFLHFLYNGLLQLPRDQFMRVQIFNGQKEGVPDGPAHALPQRRPGRAQWGRNWVAQLASDQDGAGLWGKKGAGSVLGLLVGATSMVASGVQGAADKVVSGVTGAASKVGSTCSSLVQGARRQMGLDRTELEQDHTTKTTDREKARLRACKAAEGRAKALAKARAAQAVAEACEAEALAEDRAANARAEACNTAEAHAEACAAKGRAEARTATARAARRLVEALCTPTKRLRLTGAAMGALNALDDASEDALDVYNKTGIFLSNYYGNRMEDFVRCYVFGNGVLRSGQAGVSYFHARAHLAR